MVSAEEVTKRTLRVQTWRKIQDGNTPYRRFVFNRISYFSDADKAAALLAEQPEFKNASKNFFKIILIEFKLSITKYFIKL